MFLQLVNTIAIEKEKLLWTIQSFKYACRVYFEIDESIFNKVLNTGFILNMNFVNNNVSTTCKYDSDSEEKFRKILKLSNIILYYFFLQNAIHDFKFRRENSK